MTAFRPALAALVVCLCGQARAQEPFCRVTAVGDIMLGRGVAKEMERHGPHYPFSGIDLKADSPSVVVGNLESMLTDDDYQSTSPYRFRADPAAGGSALGRAGFTFLSLANNHSGDCGSGGLDETIRTLDSLGIGWSGRRETPSPAGQAGDSPQMTVSRPAFAEISGTRIGFLAFCQPHLLGSPEIAPADSAFICRSLDAIRDSCHIIIASFHWGNEYQLFPTKGQRYLGRLAVRAGASLVHGHHPHILQGVEFYQNGVVAYSLGNFIFDQRDSLANQSAILQAAFRGTSVDSVWLAPAEIANKQPQPLKRRDRKRFQRHVDSLNAPFRTRSQWTERGLLLYPGP